MSIDLAAVLRRRKPERKTSQLSLRHPSDLKSVYGATFGGRPLFVLDTNVYILDAAGRLPPEAAQLVDRGLPFHCSVCLAELATGVAQNCRLGLPFAIIMSISCNLCRPHAS